MHPGAAAPTFPPQWRQGARLFDAREYWEAHEAWEGPWLRASGAERDALQALILLAAALHKRWAHGSLTARNYHKARRRAAGLAPGDFGVDWPVLFSEVWAGLQSQAVHPRVATLERDEQEH